MEQKKDEQMVYIKDLLFTVFYRWKAVLAAALVLALALGGLKMLSGGSLSQEEAEKVATYETEKTAMEQRIVSLQKSVTERQTHLEESLLMQLDPYNHYEAQVTVCVQLTAGEPGFDAAFATQALLEAYRAVAVEESCAEKLSGILQQPAQYVFELIGSTEPAIGTDTVTFRIKCKDSKTAAALAEAVQMHLEQYRDQISQSVAQHSLTVLKSTALATADDQLAETQRIELVRLAETLSALTDAKNKRNALARPDAADAGAIMKNTVLFAAVGAFAGVFFTVCLLWVCHIGSGKVYSGRTFVNRTGAKVLGCLDSGSKRGPLERRLRELEGRAQTQDPTLLAADIAIRAGQKKLLITGSGDAGVRKALTQALQKNLPAVTEADCLLTAPEALEALAACDMVVLVESCSSSRYQDAKRQMEKIDDYGKTLLGCVVVDG